jgi:hypothetical protein
MGGTSSGTRRVGTGSGSGSGSSNRVWVRCMGCLPGGRGVGWSDGWWAGGWG